MERITDRAFIEGYCDWCSKVNWYAAQLFLKQLKSVKSVEVKKALFVKIYMELIQAGEHLLAFVHTVKKSDSLVGFKKRLVKCPSGADSFRYLWNDLRKMKSKPRRLYNYLGVDLSDSEYEQEKKAFDGFYLTAMACLRNRYIHSRHGRTSRVLKAFAKMKHGFPLHSPLQTDRIYIYLSSGQGIRKIQTNLDSKFAEKMCGTTEAIHNGMVNISAIILDRGITSS